MTVILSYVATKDDSDFFGLVPPHVKFEVRQRHVHTAESRLALSELWVFICWFRGRNCLSLMEVSGYKQFHEMSEMGNIIIIYIMENIWYTKTAQKI